VLAGISAASAVGSIALGPRAGARVRRCGEAGEALEAPPRGRRRARLDGFDLHATVGVRGESRERLEKLCRYGLRPPIARDRLPLTADGHVVLQLRRRWSDGTTHLLFDPIELLARLAALTPRPRANLVLYYGVRGARSRWRRLIAGPAAAAGMGGSEPGEVGERSNEAAGGPTPSRHPPGEGALAAGTGPGRDGRAD
jgi:hypothetical protein